MTRSKPFRTADYLGHITGAIDNIRSYTAGMDAAHFKADRKTQDAVMRNLEIIGELLWGFAHRRPGPAPDGVQGLDC